MLNIYYGNMKKAIYNTDMYFKNTYEESWLLSDFAKKVIREIDHSEVMGGKAIDSPVLGVIPPVQLSGGTKTLLLIYNVPTEVFNASTCGDNCAKFILEMAEERDITINLRHNMNFGDEKFKTQVKVLNTGEYAEDSGWDRPSGRRGPCPHRDRRRSAGGSSRAITRRIRTIAFQPDVSKEKSK